MASDLALAFVFEYPERFLGQYWYIVHYIDCVSDSI
jgi:hypothetical protein